MIGVDEVGRGCLAGPLLIVAARQGSELPDGLADSKILTRSKRESLLDLLLGTCEFGEGWVEAREIDQLGLTKAMKLGVARALLGLSANSSEEIIIDGFINYAPANFTNVRCLIRADALVPLVSAASIYAKVTRDKFMATLTSAYPEYGFDQHVGYGTPKHLTALKSYGSINGVHRKSFKPIRPV